MKVFESVPRFWLQRNINVTFCFGFFLRLCQILLGLDEGTNGSSNPISNIFKLIYSKGSFL